MGRYYYRKRHGWLALLIIVIAGLLFGGQKSGLVGQAGRTVASDQPGLYSINHFVDGDTIAVNMNGKVEKVRLVGVDKGLWSNCHPTPTDKGGYVSNPQT